MKELLEAVPPDAIKLELEIDIPSTSNSGSGNTLIPREKEPAIEYVEDTLMPPKLFPINLLSKDCMIEGRVSPA